MEKSKKAESVIPQNNNIEQLTALYLESLDEKTLKTLEIAKDHLGSSFSLKKSIDFLKWKAEYESKITTTN